MNYFQKYEKYKKKYLHLKGGNPQLIAENNRLRLENNRLQLELTHIMRQKVFNDVIKPDVKGFLESGQSDIMQYCNDWEEADDKISDMYYGIKRNINFNKLYQLDEVSKNNFFKDFKQYVRKNLNKDLSEEELSQKGYDEMTPKRSYINGAIKYVIQNFRSDYKDHDPYEESDDEFEEIDIEHEESDDEFGDLDDDSEE